MSMRQTATRVAISLVLVAACRPPIGGDAGPSASSIAGSLIPSREIAVAVHLPGAPDALASAVTRAAGSESIAGAGVVIEIVIPYAGEDAFAVRDRDGQTDLFFATPAAALIAREAGNDLVMVAGLQRTYGLQLAAPPNGAASLQDLAGGSLLVQGRPGDEAPLLAALTAAGVEPSGVGITFPEDPSIPFDPTGLFDGSFGAAAVTSYDGAARLQEFYDLESGIPLGPDGSVALEDESGAIAAAPGMGIWVVRSTLENEDHRIALALTLIAIADGLASCRDDAVECGVVLGDSGIADRYGDGLVWSVNAFNATLWPAPDGAFTIDEQALTDAVAQAVAVGLAASAPSADDLIDRRVLDLALANLPANVDLVGASWAPLEVQLPLE